jgi:CRISPR-associated protein Csx10
MVAEDGLLYSPYVLSEIVELDRDQRSPGGPAYAPTRFVSHVWGLPVDDAARLEEIAALGGSGSRGLGQVSIRAELVDEGTERWKAVRARIEALDAQIGAAWALSQKLGGKPGEKPGCHFTVGLWSDAVLHTADGLPTMVLDAEMLREATGVEAKLVRSYASYGYSGGWQSAWGLPKPAQVVARAGSVYLFEAKHLSEDDVRALAALEIAGVGARTQEGYGWVRISDDFHLVRRVP